MYKTVYYTVSFAALFAFLTVLGAKIVFPGNIHDDFNHIFIKAFGSSDILVFGGLFALFYTGLFYLSLLFGKNSKIHTLFTKNPLIIKNKLIFGSILFCIILLCWLPYILTLYPCCLLPDSLQSLNQATGNAGFNNHHPLLFTFIVMFFINTGNMLHLNMSDSLFLFSFSQTLFFAFTVTYFIVWLARRGINKYICYLILGYFLFSPVFIFYAIQVQKDTLFSLMCFHITLMLADIASQKESYFNSQTNILKLIVVLLLIVFLRNNGIYVVFILLTGLFIILPKLRKRILLFSSVFIAIILIITSPVYKNAGLKGPAVEAYGLPLQQIARTVVYNGNTGAEDLAFINNLFPLEDFVSCYKPCIVDPIKWSGKFNHDFLRDNQAKFMLVWARNALRNPGLYTEAFILNTFGFWAFGEKNAYGYLDTYVVDNDYGIRRINLLNNRLGINIENFIAKYDYMGSGSLFWILLLSLYAVLYNKKYKNILVLLPCFAVWLSIMAATPVAFSLRYVFILALSLPLLLVLPFISLNENTSPLPYKNENILCKHGNLT